MPRDRLHVQQFTLPIRLTLHDPTISGRHHQPHPPRGIVQQSPSREPDRAHAQRRLLRWFTEIADHEVPELLRLARTIDAWSEELLA